MQNNKTVPSVVILAAGKGSRIGDQASYLHKALLPLERKPVITHIIEQFPPSCPVIIALGHLAEQLKTYLEIAHPERKFRFVKVKDYLGKGSGPGRSLLECKPHIPDGPFYVTTADTLILEPIPEIDEHWIGVSIVDQPARFCTVAVNTNKMVTSFADKDPNTHNRLAFNGIFAVAQGGALWSALQKDKQLIQNETQLSNGLKGLMLEGLRAKTLQWVDTGSSESYLAAQKQFSKKSFGYMKEFELTFEVNRRIIKWYKDEKTILARAARAKLLRPFVPEISSMSSHFYAYERMPGDTLYNSIGKFEPDDLFNWAQNTFWQGVKLDRAGIKKFQNACLSFYRDKTKARVSTAFQKLHMKDGAKNINGCFVPSVRELLEKVPWNALVQNAIPSRIHGDLQFDNILLTKQKPAEFKLIDWRQDFGGLDFGDRYYDLAKLYACFDLNHLEIKNGRRIPLERLDDDQFAVEHVTSETLQAARTRFESFCARHHYRMHHIRMIAALVYLNMSALHAAPFNAYLMILGQLKLALSFIQELESCESESSSSATT